MAHMGYFSSKELAPVSASGGELHAHVDLVHRRRKGLCASPVLSLVTFLCVLFPPFPTQSNGTHDPGGYLCHSCVQQRLGPFTLLTVSPSIVQAMDVAMEAIEVPRHIAVLYELF